MKVQKIARVIFFAAVACGTVGYMGYGYILPILMGWPLTVDSASNEVISILTEEQKVELASANKDQLIFYHFGLGMAIRNEFGLWGGNWALLNSACDKPCHPDDASMVIIEHTWERLRSQRGKK